MSPQTLQKAIEPFFSTKPVGKGTGLGLSMVHGLAVQLGGALQLSSVVGRGTTATLVLPVTTKAPEVIDEARIENHTARSAVILFVDDDPLIAMSTTVRSNLSARSPSWSASRRPPREPRAGGCGRASGLSAW